MEDSTITRRSVATDPSSSGGDIPFTTADWWSRPGGHSKDIFDSTLELSLRDNQDTRARVCGLISTRFGGH